MVLKSNGMIKHWAASVSLCDVRSFLFCRTEESRIAREQEKEEYSNFVLKACQMIKEHKTAIHVRDVEWTFLTERGIFLDNSFSTQTITAPIVIREVKHHVYVKRQTRICTMWPTFLFTCLLRFISSTPKLVVSRNFLSIRIVFSCFCLLIFYFEKFWTRIWRLPSTWRLNSLLAQWLMTIWNLINLIVESRTLQLYTAQFSSCSLAGYNGWVIKTKSNLERGLGNLWTCIRQMLL